jgi:3-dehydroquinate synthase
MRTLRVNLDQRSYPIHVGARLLGQPELLLPHLVRKQAAIVTNTTVAPLLLEKFAAPLAAAGVEVISIVVEDGEEYKTWATVDKVCDALLARRCGRDTTLIALGGGVIGDLTGFAAAIYQRGVPFVQIPTTLLAQVDSSVGGKTAINHPRGKNMIGAFYQPRVVIADTDSLRSLPPRELRAGLAEVIKHGVIRDPAFFAWLEQNIDRLLRLDEEAVTHAVVRSMEIKADVVGQDEREQGLRAILNFGHTFGHAIETGMGYGAWLHGEAVAAGMAMAADLSARLGLIDRQLVERIHVLLRRAGLPVEAPQLGIERFHELMSIDKKAESGRVRFVLIERLGSAVVRGDVPAQLLDATLASMQAP